MIVRLYCKECQKYVECTKNHMGWFVCNECGNETGLCWKTNLDKSVTLKGDD